MNLMLVLFLAIKYCFKKEISYTSVWSESFVPKKGKKQWNALNILAILNVRGAAKNKIDPTLNYTAASNVELIKIFCLAISINSRKTSVLHYNIINWYNINDDGWNFL